MGPRARTRIGAALAFAVAALAVPAGAAAGPSEVRVLTPPKASVTKKLAPAIPLRSDLDACVGRPVLGAEVAIDGEAWGTRRLPPITVVRGGEPFTEALVRRAMAEVMSGAGFARATAEAVDEGPGCRIVVRAVVRRLIERLEIDLGGAKVDRDELLREGDFVEGGEFIGAELGDKQERMEALLARHGYPDANVSLRTQSTDDPLRLVALLEVRPGAPRVVERRVFYVFGAKPADIDRDTSTYRVKRADRADETQLESSDLQLAARLRARGYHQAEVSHDVVQADGMVVLRVRVDTGKLVRPRFEGNEHYDAEALEGALDIENESDFAPSHLTDKLRRFYQERGFFDVEIGVETRGEDGEHVHHLVFKIIEHDRVSVVARSYPCLRQDDIRRLREGGPTSVSAVGREIDSFLEEELPGADILKSPDPRGVDALVEARGPKGARPVPIDLEPNGTFVADTYERALDHVQELYRHEGFLHAQVGPVQVVRRRCDPRSPTKACVPIPLPASGPDLCTYDATNLPLPVPAADPATSCVPDPLRGVRCEPKIALRVPIKLGPRTQLYDLQFVGARAISEKDLGAAAGIALGSPANTIRLEEARRRILDAYREEGYAFADVKYTLEESLDHTRARARFEVSEGEQVIVSQVVIQGNELTRAGVIRRRIALEVGQPYRASLVRKTEERIATLNVFSSVQVGLADPAVPAKYKTVVVTLSERVPGLLYPGVGISSGEGFRLMSEFGYANLFGTAIGVTSRVQISYLPDAFIIDERVRANFRALERDQGIEGRIAGRITVRGDFPDVGLGPLVRMGLDGVLSRQLQRDFVLTKAAIIPSMTYKPLRQLSIAVSPSAEQNTVGVFNQLTLDDYLRLLQSEGGRADLARNLRVPDGTSNAFAQRVLVTWDRRDNSFNARSGTFFASGVEHVDWYPHNTLSGASSFDGSEEARQARANQEGHFVRFTETISGYIPFGRKVSLALALRVGTNVQLRPNSQTYPDRLFFLGGVESMRGWPQDYFVPQDLADRIEADRNKAADDPTKFTVGSIAIRGGNLMVNPKVELRIPIKGPFETAIFSDMGNLWVDPLYPFSNGFALRFSVGSGIRFQTPIGPLAFDYGINATRRRAYEDFGAFHFSIGLF